MGVLQCVTTGHTKSSSQSLDAFIAYFEQNNSTKYPISSQLYQDAKKLMANQLATEFSGCIIGDYPKICQRIREEATPEGFAFLSIKKQRP